MHTVWWDTVQQDGNRTTMLADGAGKYSET